MLMNDCMIGMCYCTSKSFSGNQHETVFLSTVALLFCQDIIYFNLAILKYTLLQLVFWWTWTAPQFNHSQYIIMTEINYLKLVIILSKKDMWKIPRKEPSLVNFCKGNRIMLILLWNWNMKSFSLYTSTLHWTM